MSVPDSEALVTAAQDYRRRGWRVLPLYGVSPDGHGVTACDCRAGQRCGSPGKHPIQTSWQDAPEMSGADIQATFEEGKYNIGIATGAPSGFWVLDIDLDKAGTHDRVRDLQEGHGKFPPTFLVRTGGAGYQYYFAMPDFNVTNSARRLPDGVDVRGTGGQVVAPPSVSGKGPYVVVMDTEPVRAPAWLEELVRPAEPVAPVDLETLPKLTDLSAAEQQRLRGYTSRAVQVELDRLDQCKTKGWSGPGWNQTTFEVSCSLIELANSPWSPITLVQAHNVVLARAPRDANFDDAEIESCFSSALRTVAGEARAMPPNRQPEVLVIPGDPLTDPTAGGGSAGNEPVPSPTEQRPIALRDWSDLGNARRMVDLFGRQLRWVPEAKEWAVYTDGLWETAGASTGLALAHDMIEGLVEREVSYYSDTPTGPNGDKPSEQEQFIKWAHGQQMSSRIDACLKQATGRPEMVARITDFDRPEHLLNVANGVVDLTSGELLEHDPDMLMMLQSPVEYVPDAPAPRWHKFLDRCLPDPDVQTYLQRVFGYSITGSTAEQALFIHHGSGANGKSVFLIVASHVTGTYGQVVPRETLLTKGVSSEHPTSVARMRGKRFLQASETAAGRRLDEEMVKGLTGGEQQPARFMGKDFFDFTPTGKIHFVTNHLPRLTDADSIWRRLHLIGWRETIAVEEQDKTLAQKIIAEEAEGVLAWAVQGAVSWYRAPLSMPGSVRRDLLEYRTDQDILGEFLNGRLERDPLAFAATSDIYAAYAAWCFNNGIKAPMTAQDLGRAIKERGFAIHRTGRSRGFRARLLPVNHDVDTDQSDPLVAR